MKCEQASILGKLRRQIAQPSDSPSQRPPRTPQFLRQQAPQTPSPLGTWDHATPLPGQPRPHFGQVTRPSGPAPSRGLLPVSLESKPDPTHLPPGDHAPVHFPPIRSPGLAHTVPPPRPCPPMNEAAGHPAPPPASRLGPIRTTRRV